MDTTAATVTAETPGELVKLLRTKAGVSQKDLAGRIGMDPSRLSRIESGEIEWKDLRLREEEAIERELGVQLGAWKAERSGSGTAEEVAS